MTDPPQHPLNLTGNVRNVSTLEPKTGSRKQLSDFRTKTGSDDFPVAVAKFRDCLVTKRSQYTRVLAPKPEPEPGNTKHETTAR